MSNSNKISTKEINKVVETTSTENTENTEDLIKVDSSGTGIFYSTTLSGTLDLNVNVKIEYQVANCIDTLHSMGSVTIESPELFHHTITIAEILYPKAVITTDKNTIYGKFN